MKIRKNLKTRHDQLTLLIHMLTGAVIALIIIIFFLYDTPEPDPGWPKLWFIRPLIIVPLAGSLGGAFYFFTGLMRSRGGWRKILAGALSLAVYLISLWAGTILSLNGTWWD